MENPERVSRALAEDNRSSAARSTRRRLLRRAAGTAAIGGAVLEGALTPPVAQAQGLPQVGGTWQAQLMRDSPPPGFGPTHFLFVFTAEGDVIAAGPPVLIENGVRAFLTTQLGQWQQTGGASFGFTFNTASFSEDGSLNNTINSHMDMIVANDGRSWTGGYTRQDVAPDGAVMRTLTGTAVAQAIPAQA
jgi:hypothetical protein